MTHPQNNLEPTHHEIVLLAYTISQSQKGHHRSAEENWFEAERILKEQRLQALTREKSELKNNKGKQPSGKK